MALRNRQTLKNYFQRGELPRQGHFEDFIDSAVNIIDDGISVSLKDGLKITPLGEMGNLISFYREVEDELPQWSVVLDKSNNVLSINNYDNDKIISFTNDGNVGIGKETPEQKLDVKGIIAMGGRKGTHQSAQKVDSADSNRVPANGSWHSILSGLNGAQAFEVMAGVGKRKSGKYALLHATAISTYGKSNWKIRKTQACYRWFWDKILIRFKGNTYDYSLQVRTMLDYGEGHYINYHISQLWHDEFMNVSQALEAVEQKVIEPTSE